MKSIMKYVSALSTPELETLKEAVAHHSNHRARMRAHAIMLSSRHYSIIQLADIFDVDRDTLSHWFDLWKTKGLVAIFDSERSGRPPILTSEEIKRFAELVQDEPRQLKKAHAQLTLETGKKFSLQCLISALKKLHFTYKRCRRSLKKQRDEAHFLQSKIQLTQLQSDERQGFCKLYYFDESGFCLVPSLPYAWQRKGETIGLPSDAHTKRINVLGFLSREEGGFFQSHEGRVDKNVVIDVFEQFIKTLNDNQPIYIVLDNASTHRSKLFKAAAVKWGKSKNIILVYLPPYSPELNLIEILWKMIKYYWLPMSAYCSFDTLKQELSNILNQYTSKYWITFQ